MMGKRHKNMWSDDNVLYWGASRLVTCSSSTTTECKLTLNCAHIWPLFILETSQWEEVTSPILQAGWVFMAEFSSRWEDWMWVVQLQTVKGNCKMETPPSHLSFFFLDTAGKYCILKQGSIYTMNPYSWHFSWQREQCSSLLPSLNALKSSIIASTFSFYSLTIKLALPQ